MLSVLAERCVVVKGQGRGEPRVSFDPGRARAKGRAGLAKHSTSSCALSEACPVHLAGVTPFFLCL